MKRAGDLENGCLLCSAHNRTVCSHTRHYAKFIDSRSRMVNNGVELSGIIRKRFFFRSSIPWTMYAWKLLAKTQTKALDCTCHVVEYLCHHLYALRYLFVFLSSLSLQIRAFHACLIDGPAVLRAVVRLKYISYYKPILCTANATSSCCPCCAHSLGVLARGAHMVISPMSLLVGVPLSFPNNWYACKFGG